MSQAREPIREVRAHTPRARDEAIARLRRLNRWLIAGSAALTGIFTAAAASAFPGRTVRTSTTQASKRSAASADAQHHRSALRPPAESPEAAESSEAPAAAESSEAPAAAESSEAPASSGQPEAEAPVVSGGS